MVGRLKKTKNWNITKSDMNLYFFPHSFLAWKQCSPKPRTKTRLKRALQRSSLGLMQGNRREIMLREIKGILSLKFSIFSCASSQVIPLLPQWWHCPQRSPGGHKELKSRRQGHIILLSDDLDSLVAERSSFLSPSSCHLAPAKNYSKR